MRVLICVDDMITQVCIDMIRASRGGGAFGGYGVGGAPKQQQGVNMPEAIQVRLYTCILVTYSSVFERGMALYGHVYLCMIWCGRHT